MTSVTSPMQNSTLPSEVQVDDGNSGLDEVIFTFSPR
jgi:hypothetical protein